MQVNRVAYEKAFAWIKENKLQFLKLIVLRQTRFLCCDDTGALMFDHPSAPAVANRFMHQILALISNIFWIILALLILYGSLNYQRLAKCQFTIVMLTLLGIYYMLVIFSLFQSESKHHTLVMVFFALMASCAFQPFPSRLSRNRTGSATR